MVMGGIAMADPSRPTIKSALWFGLSVALLYICNEYRPTDEQLNKIDRQLDDLEEKIIKEEEEKENEE